MTNKKERSIFKNVPVSLMDELMVYRTEQSATAIRWRYRKPKDGVKYGLFGNVKREDATAATMYLDIQDDVAAVAILESQNLELKDGIALRDGIVEVLRKREADANRKIKELVDEVLHSESNRGALAIEKEKLAVEVFALEISRDRWVEKYKRQQADYEGRWLVRNAMKISRWLDRVRAWWHDPFGDYIVVEPCNREDDPRADAKP